MSRPTRSQHASPAADAANVANAIRSHRCSASDTNASGRHTSALNASKSENGAGSFAGGTRGEGNGGDGGGEGDGGYRGGEGNGGYGGYGGAGGNGRPSVVSGVVPSPRVHAASAGNGAHCHPPRTTTPHRAGAAPNARRKFAGNARSVGAVSSRQKHAASLNARNLSQQDARAPSSEAAARVAAHPSCTKRTSSEAAHEFRGGAGAGDGNGDGDGDGDVVAPGDGDGLSISPGGGGTSTGTGTGCGRGCVGERGAGGGRGSGRTTDRHRSPTRVFTPHLLGPLARAGTSALCCGWGRVRKGSRQKHRASLSARSSAQHASSPGEGAEASAVSRGAHRSTSPTSRATVQGSPRGWARARAVDERRSASVSKVARRRAKGAIARGRGEEWRRRRRREAPRPFRRSRGFRGFEGEKSARLQSEGAVE